MREIALYYPYIHVRDDDWLKAAALFWPKLARLTPSEYPRHDSDVARALHEELGFFVDIAPHGEQVIEVSSTFFEFLRANERRVRRRYGPKNATKIPGEWRDAWREMQAATVVNEHRHLGWVHVDKMTVSLQRRMERYGLGTYAGENRHWFVLHPALTAAYTTSLIDRVAEANDLATVTDQVELHKLHRAADDGEFAAMLLGDRRVRPKRTADDVAALYATISVDTVVPGGLADVPVRRIVGVREKLAAEFDVFHAHLDALAEDFAELAGIANPEILRTRLNLMVRRDLRRPTAELERSLRQLGLEPARAALGMKTLELPAAAATVAAAAGLPAVAGQAGMVTAKLASAAAGARAAKRAARLSGPAGYLLSVRNRLEPTGLRGLLRRLSPRRS